MPELDHLRAAIIALEQQRSSLGDAVVDAAIAGLRQRIDGLAEPERAQAAGERKQVTVMFADLSGFTALSERVDPEQVRNVVNTCFERAGVIVTRYGGYIDKFIGDELMVLFGAPRAIEDHASRALHAAIEIRAAVSAFNREDAILRDYPLSMHFGINTGLVIAGAMGTEKRREYTVIGDPVNVAARLVSRADAGEILVGADTRRLVDAGFQFENIGAFELDGRVQLTEIFRLLAARADARSTRDVGVGDTPMFGRAWELQTMKDVFGDAVSKRRARSVVVVGPAGIGKSRLLGEFLAWQHEHHPEVLVLHGTALPHTVATPYFIIADLLRNLLNVNERDTAGSIRRRLEAAITGLGITQPEVAQGIAALMAIEDEHGVFPESSPEERKERVFSGVTTMLRHAAGQNPVLLVFEDLHWADDLSLELLEHGISQLVQFQITFIAVTRSIIDADSKALELESRLPSATHTRLDLADLESDASAAFVRALAPGIERYPGVVETIVRQGQGNPFFLQAIVGMLMDREVLVRDDHGVVIARNIADVQVPDTVWGVLAERIDRLPPEEKRVVQMSAIIGRLFWEGLVRELTQVAAGLQLQALHHRDFVDRVGPAAFGDDWEWMFRHVLVQEVAYSGLLRETRKSGHVVAARWLEQRIGDRRNEYGTLLAHHYRRGEAWEKASEFAELAGDRAAALYALREARVSYGEAIESLRMIVLDDHTRRRLVDVTLKLADVSYFTPSEHVHQALEAAKRLAEELGDEDRGLRVMTATASWLYQAGQGRPAVEMALQCIAKANAIGLDEFLILPYQIVGRAMFAMGEYQKCVEMIGQSNALAETYGREVDHTSLGFLGMAYLNLGEVERGQAYGVEGLRMAERRGDLRRIASAKLYMSTSLVAVGFLEEVGPHLQDAVRLARETGDFSVSWVALGGLGYWYAQQGDTDMATECLDEALGMAADLGSYLTVPLLQAYRGEVDIALGNFEAAADRTRAAAQLGKDTRQQTFEAEARRVLAWALAYQSQRDEALAEFGEALDLHHKTGARVLECRSLFQFAELLRSIGEEAQADEREAAAAAIARDCGLHWLPGPVPRPRAPRAPTSDGT